ncbi:MAG TPA: beta-glucosidase BglX [Bacteroidales bacterium]|nr:beta-glucosidase BglX [Bacteroidales bacterium]
MIKKLILMATAILIVSCQQQQTGQDSEIENKVEDLLSKMTLSEKIGQMNQLSSSGNADDFKEMLKKGMVGSFLNEVNPVTINKMQKVVMEESRLKIPLLFSRDVIHGYKTIFPIPLGQAASWNPDIIEKGARVAAQEASEAGIRWTFAPMIDITRDPRWGRIAESLGEDPVLTSVLGAAMVKGFQGKSLNDTNSLAACVKHFCGYGATEGGRDYNTTIIPEQTLREVYLPSFKASIDAGAATLMVSFNEINGVPSSGNDFLLRQVLRKEWNFDGMVVSDWGSVEEMINHGFCADRKEAAMKAINAGVEMEMVTSTYVEHVENLIKEGKIKESTIDEAVRNILRLKFRLGLFDKPYVAVNSKSSLYSDEHLASAKEAAIQSLVLLKNENNTLPIKSTVKSVAIIGPLADAPYDQMGTWTLDGEQEHTITPLVAIKEEFGKQVKVNYAKGLEYSRDLSTKGFTAAISAARQSDVILMFAGEESILSGEARCRADITFPGKQRELIAELKKTGKPLVLVIMAGRPLAITEESKIADAIVYAWHPGTMGGPAIADVLFGKVPPSGKLPVTFPQMTGQIPVYYSQKNSGRPAKEPLMLLNDIPVSAKQFTLGCSSYYLDAGYKPLYPFGYGLSYTTFVYSDLKLSKNQMKKEDQMEISCKITNTGNVEATEIVQLYIRDLVGSLTRPVKELKDFKRVAIKPGETVKITFTLNTNQLKFWNAKMEQVVEPGQFKVWIAPNSSEGLEGSFEVTE